MPVPLYDDFEDYDRFVNWSKRLAYELPFIEQQLVAAGAKRVLDAACGTGKHAIALAGYGYEVTGADLSTSMIERARANALAERVTARFVVAGFGELAARVGSGFDALLCLGSSLPHVLTDQALQVTLLDMAAILNPGGVLVIQNRNFDAMLANRERWMPPQGQHEEGHDWLFLRFYDFNPDGTLTFHVVTLRRKGTEPWQQRIQETLLRPWRHDELVRAVAEAGLGQIQCYGDMNSTPFDPVRSSNLIVVSHRPRALHI